jgi:hypothetical protein
MTQQSGATTFWSYGGIKFKFTVMMASLLTS